MVAQVARRFTPAWSSSTRFVTGSPFEPSSFWVRRKPAKNLNRQIFRPPEIPGSHGNRFQVRRDAQSRLGGRLHVLRLYSRGDLAQHQALRRDLDDGELGD